MNRIRIAKSLMRIARSLMAADAEMEIAKSGDRWERIKLAENPRTSAEVLNLLAEDSDKMVRAAVAKNPSCDEDTLTMLADDDEFLVSKPAEKALEAKGLGF